MNVVYSRENLPKTKFRNKIKDGAYVINLDDHSNIGAHWVALYISNNKATYFDSFGVEHIPKEIKKTVKRSTIVTNIFRIQACDSLMCEYFCIGFIDFMFKGKSLTANLFSPNDKQQFRLNKTNGIKDYFIAELKERELMSKKLSKYIASFDYFDKSLIVLSGTSGSISIASFATVIGTTVGIASLGLSLKFSLPTGIVKKLLKTTRNKKEKA